MIQSPIVDVRQKILDGEVAVRELATIALEQANWRSPTKKEDASY